MSSTTAGKDQEYFQLTRHGDVMVLVPSADIENLPSNLIEPAAEIVLASLKQNAATSVIVDLSQVGFFGSEFITFLLRCHVIVKKHFCELVLAGCSPQIRELVRQMALDTLWAIYDSRTQALDALSGSD